MLDMLTKLTGFIIIAVLGFYIIKTITKSEVKLFTPKNIALLSLLIIVPFLLATHILRLDISLLNMKKP